MTAWVIDYEELADALLRSLDRASRLEEMVKRLDARLEEEAILLRSALHELAVERGENVDRFINSWYRRRSGAPR